MTYIGNNFQLPFSKLNIYKELEPSPHKDKKVLVCLHGWLDNHRSFLKLAEHLPDYNLIRLDLPGHGYSDHIAEGLHYDFPTLMRLSAELIISLPYNSITLVGHSMGAALVSMIASSVQAISHKINNLILIEGLGPLSMPSEQSPQQFHKWLEYLNQSIQSPASPLRPFQTIETAAKLRQKAGDLDYTSALALTEANLQQQPDGHYTWRYDQRLRAPSVLRLTEEQVMAFLAALDIPTLFIQAERSIFRHADVLETRKAQLKKLETTVCPGGHHLHMDNPGPVARAIDRYLSQYPR